MLQPLGFICSTILERRTKGGEVTIYINFEVFSEEKVVGGRNLAFSCVEGFLSFCLLSPQQNGGGRGEIFQRVTDQWKINSGKKRRARSDIPHISEEQPVLRTLRRGVFFYFYKLSAYMERL